VSISAGETVSWLALVPRDTVFVRDGRSFDAAADTVAQTIRPGPSTIAGAVGAAFGARPGAPPEDLPAEVRGPVLAQRVGAGWEPYFPVPQDLVQEDGSADPYVFRLAVTAAAGRTDLDAAGLSWLTPPAAAGFVKPLQGWMPCAQLARYLRGDMPGAGGEPATELGLTDPDRPPLRPELRVGLARAPGRETRAGFLYQATHLRPEDGWGFLAGCLLRPGWDRAPAGPVPFGGRVRLADVEQASTAGWPHMPAGFPGGRVLVYLATPGLWPGGWHIPVPDGARLIAAATGEPEPVATITPGGKWADSRALRWAVPAGSVYLLEFAGEADAVDWAARHHGTAYGRAENDRLRTAGFGIVLTGAWT
jgi:CRISPR type III-B/RAMP module-associated protein Cmr3